MELVRRKIDDVVSYLFTDDDKKDFFCIIDALAKLILISYDRKVGTLVWNEESVEFVWSPW